VSHPLAKENLYESWRLGNRMKLRLLRSARRKRGIMKRRTDLGILERPRRSFVNAKVDRRPLFAKGKRIRYKSVITPQFCDAD